MRRKRFCKLTPRPTFCNRAVGTMTQSHFTSLPPPLSPSAPFCVSTFRCRLSCTDKRWGCSVGAKWPLKWRFYRSTLQMKGYKVFSGMPSKSMATVNECNFFSFFWWIKILKIRQPLSCLGFPMDYSHFLHKAHTTKSQVICWYASVAIWQTDLADANASWL